MIELTRINHVPLIVNSDLIEFIETAPDTILTLTNGQKFNITFQMTDNNGTVKFVKATKQ